MKIVHVLFDDYPYVIDWGYQENKLVKYQLQKYDVTIITGKYIPDVLSGFLKYNQLNEYEELTHNSHKLKIYRLNCLFGNSFFGKKIKLYKKLKNILYIENPDVIFIHDLHALSLKTVNKYLKNKNIICNADIHVNYVNSCRNKLSFILHKYFYRCIIKNNISKINNIYYLNENSKQFVEKLYGLNEEKNSLKFLPLGGDIFQTGNKLKKQKEYKNKCGLPEDTIIFMHSGKMNRLKKTIEIIDSFLTTYIPNFCLLLIGTPSEEIKEEFFDKIQRDKRIHYLGWKTNNELMDYLIVCDVYLQPGSPSVTAHEALCKGCATVLSSEGGFYTQFINEESAIYINKDMNLVSIFKKIQESPEFIERYKKNGYDLATKIFDYRVQSELILKN